MEATPATCGCDGVKRTYIDESYRTVSETGTYSFAAITLEVSQEQSARDALRAALPNKLRRFHWHGDTDRTRDIAARELMEANVDAVLFVQEGVPEAKVESYRQHGFWELVIRLADKCCHDLCFEARENRQNQRDQETLTSIARADVAGPLFRYRFGRPHDEPLLWLPDIALGVFGTHQAGNGRWWNAADFDPEVVRVLPRA